MWYKSHLKSRQDVKPGGTFCRSVCLIERTFSRTKFFASLLGLNSRSKFKNDSKAEIVDNGLKVLFSIRNSSLQFYSCWSLLIMITKHRGPAVRRVPTLALYLSIFVIVDNCFLMHLCCLRFVYEHATSVDASQLFLKRPLQQYEQSSSWREIWIKITQKYKIHFW